MLRRYTCLRCTYVCVCYVCRSQERLRNKDANFNANFLGEIPTGIKIPCRKICAVWHFFPPLITQHAIRSMSVRVSEWMSTQLQVWEWGGKKSLYSVDRSDGDWPSGDFINVKKSHLRSRKRKRKSLSLTHSNTRTVGVCPRAELGFLHIGYLGVEVVTSWVHGVVLIIFMATLCSD